MNRLLYSLSVLGLVLFLTMGTAGVVYGDDDDVIRLSFDVAQDGNTFVLIGPNIGGFALQGAVFSVQGFVYPKGTLQGGAVSGTDTAGNPTFPDKVAFRRPAPFPCALKSIGAGVTRGILSFCR